MAPLKIIIPLIFSGLIEDEDGRMYIEPYPAKVCKNFISCGFVSVIALEI